MTLAKSSELGITHLPDHTELPESDGTFVKNFQEHPQSILLTDSITNVLQQLHPDNQYCIGQDCGIYWRLTEPPERGAEAPDWFYVPNVPPMLNGKFRRSYVLWQEYVAPLIVLEFVSGDGSEERDKTPLNGKFWVYEQAIRVPFYGIYEVNQASVEVYHLVDGHYELVTANERGHYVIPPMGVELGIWQGQYKNSAAPWLRWWDAQGNLLLNSDEKSQQLTSQLEQEHERSHQLALQLEQEQQRAERLAERLRQLGIDPNSL
ncbi:Uma2 family endonuclease [Nostoc sp. FACHB-152]|uniref:Uma2 family endonuclease n=1 Tax=unclassified Nostoc TaxID=2593658 RepID=UPI0016841890|nr:MULTISPECIES: Uma2 family endonuclease [unclassified Nostoc]MBD2447730.1 Uma2 family endonuclease [Nostoc sp. FACHB-152]MBD2467021.1 Uma2 family endonuclease [Nostoc sp. FACHB-145]